MVAASQFVFACLLILSIFSIVSGIECPVCTNVPGLGAGKCDSGKVPKVTCPDGWNQCMSLKGKMTVVGITQSIELKNCSNNILCDSASDYNGCKLLNVTGFVTSCSLNCTTPDTSGEQELASSLKCQACGPGDVPCDGSNVRSIQCDDFADRCMTVKVTTNIPNLGPYTSVLKNCSHSTVICKESGDGYPCRKSLLPDGANCTVTCCKGDMCNQLSSEQAPTKPSTAEPVTKASSLKCQACGPGDVPCDGSNARSIECNTYADRCMTVTMTTNIPNLGPYTTVMKNCSHSTMICKESGVAYPCQKNVLPQGANCTVTCCKGDMCNQQSSEDATVSPTPKGTESTTTEPVTKASTIKCPVCTNIPHMGASKCDSLYVESKTCPIGLDRCMTVTGKAKDVVGAGVNFPTKFELTNCSNSFLCEPGSDYNMCKILNSTGLIKSCSVKCVSPIGTRPSIAGGPKINFTSVTPQVPETSNIKCPVCTNIPHMGARKCDNYYVESKTCPFGLDKCMTVAGQIKDVVGAGAIFPTKFELKNCSNSLLCEPGSDYNMCKILNATGLVKSCSVKCVSPTVTHPSGVGGPKINSTSISVEPQVPETGVFKLNHLPVCSGTKGDQFGKFYVPSSGKLAALRLVHLYGYVSCHSRSYGRWSYWGCASSKINIVVTNSTNHVILPAEQFISGETKWSKIPGYTSLSPQILLSVFSDPVEITAGEELRLWYGEDLANKDEDDNEGKVCADVYGLYV